jgi:16S rRNA (guanine1207-N2)-methyltransferase
MKKAIEDLKKDIVFSASLLGREFTFHTTWGLFSPNRIDEGSRLLLDHATFAPDAWVLDMGCGYGALGIPIAAAVPGGKVCMVDKDFVAVEYAEKNAQVNNATNCEVYLSNLFSRVPVGYAFDAIVSNVPAKAERELYDIFLLDARRYLKKDGRIYLVSISGLKEFFKKNLLEVFGNYEKLKQGGTYTVACATKRAT